MKLAINRLIAALVLLLASSFALGAMSAFDIKHTTNGSFSSHLLPPPLYTDAIVLVANVSQTQAIPSGASWLVFSATCNFYALAGAAAAVPGATTTTGVASMLNPAAWNVVGSTQITVIAPSACVVTLSFYL